jgi:MFS transporter, putative metabolite:H+ symporter
MSQESTPQISKENIPSLEIANQTVKISSGMSSVIDRIGMCSKSWFIFNVASVLQAIWGVEATFIAIYLPNVAIQFSIGNQVQAFCISLVYASMGIGSYLVGPLSQKFRRSRLMEYSCLLYFICISCNSLINEYYIIIVLRCLANCSVGIFNILAINILCEYLPSGSRCYILMADSGFFNIGTIFVIIIKSCFKSDDLYSFKIANFICCIPGLLTFLLMYFKLEESPLYLLSKGQDALAFKLLEEMAHSKGLQLEEEERSMIKIQIAQNQKTGTYSELFSNQYMKLTVLCLLVNLLGYLNLIALSYLIQKTFRLVNESKIASENILFVIYSVIQLPNGPVGGWMTESKYLKRKNTMVISQAICTIFYIISFFVVKWVSLFSGIIMFFNSICFGCSLIYVSEVYPTYLRDHAQSFIQSIVFLSGSFVPYLIEILAGKDSIMYNYIWLGASCVIGSIFSFLLPIETYQMPLDVINV